MTRTRVGILIFDDVEILDFCGPFEVFSVTRLDEAKRREEPAPFEVVLIAESRGVVTTSGGMKVYPDFNYDGCPKLDILVVPGGWGTRREAGNPRIIDFLRKRAPEVEKLTSVCTGSLLLATAGLLDGLHATSHWRFLEEFRARFPSVSVESDQHVVEDGNVLTSAGISAGIDMALRVVAHYHGEETARATARHMEYPFPEDNKRRV